MRLNLIIIFLVIIIVAPMLYVGAAQLGISLGSHSIGIILSNTCLILLKNNLSTTCPTYEVLAQLDSSNRAISGDFSYKDGFYSRDKPMLEKSYNWYAFDGVDTWRIFVDPPQEYLSRVKLITIENNFDVFIDRADRKIVNRTIIQYHDRYIDNYWDSTINSDKWEMLIPDTIFYIRNGCTGHTDFDNKEYIYLNHTKMDYTTSQKYKHDQWIKNVIENCLTEYGKCK